MSIETMARLLAGDLPHEELVREVVPHLLARCPECQALYDEIQCLLREVGHWDERVAVFEGKEAPAVFAELVNLPFSEQIIRVENEERFQGWALTQLLLQQSRWVTYDDPARAVDLAELALVLTSRLNSAYDPAWVLDLTARAWATLGNAHRVLGELRIADTAFRRARTFLERSLTGNAVVRAEILDLEASLRRDQRHFSDALGLSEHAAALYREAGEFHLAGRAVLNQAKSLEEQDDLAGAIDALREATELLDPSREPSLLVYVHHNLLVCLTRSGQFEEAEQMLPSVRALLTEHGNAVDHLRLRWVEANVALGLGRAAAAEAAFLEVRAAFFERRMGYDAALVSLDLAGLYARQGRTAELKRLAAEIVPAFESRDVHREAMAAILMFQHACEEETLTVRLAQHLAALLARERRRQVTPVG